MPRSNRVVDRCVAVKPNTRRCLKRTGKTPECWIHLMGHYHIKIKPSNIPNGGLGLFADKDFVRGEDICPYGGVFLHDYEPQMNDHYLLQIRKNPPSFLNGDPSLSNTGIGSYANSCKPPNKRAGDCSGNNAQYVPYIRNNSVMIRATKPIKKGDEIFIAYGNSFNPAQQ